MKFQKDTPEKLRLILEDLGPTFVKVGPVDVPEIRYFTEELL